MNLRFSITLFIIMLLSFFGNQSYAAFPSKTPTSEVIVKEKETFPQRLKQIIAKQAPAEERKTAADQTSLFGILSLSAALLALIFAFIPGVVTFLSIPLAIAAIIFGVLGINNPNSGLAIAGLIIGAAEILLLVLLLLVLAAYA